jgi:hypothetical protein
MREREPTRSSINWASSMILNSLGLPIWNRAGYVRGGRHLADKPVDQIVRIAEGAGLEAFAVDRELTAEELRRARRKDYAFEIGVHYLGMVSGFRELVRATATSVTQTRSNCGPTDCEFDAFQTPVSALRARLSKDAALEFHVICKLCQELEQAQEHSLLLARRRALAKVAMFLQQLERLQFARGERAADIYLPMSRSDIGEYVGMSLEAVSRALRSLCAEGIISSRDRRHLKIVDRAAFEAIFGLMRDRRGGRTKARALVRLALLVF